MSLELLQHARLAFEDRRRIRKLPARWTPILACVQLRFIEIDLIGTFAVTHLISWDWPAVIRVEYGRSARNRSIDCASTCSY